MGMKRPAAVPLLQEQSKRQAILDEKLSLPKTDSVFNPYKFIQELASKMGIALRSSEKGSSAQSSPVLHWGAAFDGSNMPGQCMKVFRKIFGVKSQQLVGGMVAITSRSRSCCGSCFLSSSSSLSQGAEIDPDCAYYCMRNYNITHMYQACRLSVVASHVCCHCSPNS